MLKKIRGTFLMLWECVTMSLDNILSNKVRSFLTLLGIMIGVTAVIALITTVSGVTGSISDQFNAMGVGTITVTITGTDLKSGVTPADMAAISALDTVDGVVPTVNLNGRVSYGKKTESSIIVSGKNAYYFNINDELIIHGRALNFIDDDNASYVCVISQKMVDTFFYGVNPIGETLYVSGLPFTVVGRYEVDNGGGVAALFTGRPDVIIPYTTAMRVNNVGEITSLTVYMAEGVTSAQAKEEMEDLLDSLFDFEDDTFTITTMDTIEDTMETMMGMMSSLLAGIASIALGVGFSAAVGIIFGWAPARKASKLNPIDALRSA
jgi:putative ABC transport system permease protein